MFCKCFAEVDRGYRERNARGESRGVASLGRKHFLTTLRMLIPFDLDKCWCAIFFR